MQKSSITDGDFYPKVSKSTGYSILSSEHANIISMLQAQYSNCPDNNLRADKFVFQNAPDVRMFPITSDGN